MFNYMAKIIAVYDGDTFTFEVDLGFSIKVTEKLRLFGVNTPEVRGQDKIFGKKVRDYVREQILGKEVSITVYKKGKYGRYVADVNYLSDLQLEPINLSKHLIEKGYAIEVDYG